MGKKGLLQYACDQIVSPERIIFRESELGPFTQQINKVRIVRENFLLKNFEGFLIRGNIYSPLEQQAPMNYVIYLHTRGGCRTEGLFLKHIMLPNFGLVLFDFAGSGFSSGDYVTLGLKESKDLEMIIDYLKQMKRVKKIILWGRSMGAITALNFTRQIDNQSIISTLIVDSPFSNFNQMIQDFVFAKFKIPRCLISFFLKKVLVKTQKKTGVDLRQINAEEWASQIDVPCFFSVTKNDNIARPSEVKKIFQNIKCKDKEFHLFPGNHASNRQIDQTVQAINFILKFNNQFIIKNDQKIECFFYLKIYLIAMTDYDYLFKFILVGDSGVGKSCLLYQFIEGKFSNSLEPTIGIEFGTKIIDLDDQVIRLQIWDSAGQENYRSITRSYYKNTICAIMVYDITKKQSFENLKKWMEEAQTHGHEEMVIIIVGNKCELDKEREVPFHTGKEYAQKNRALFFEASAKDNIGVQDLFYKVAQQISDDIKRKKINPYKDFLGIKVGLSNFNNDPFSNFQKKKKKGCCQVNQALKIN